MHVAEDALERIVSDGYSLEFGARFLKRVIDERVKLPISTRWKEGSHFEVKVEDGQIVVSPWPAKQPSPEDTVVFSDVA